MKTKIALTIAGSDSSGGAGIQADLKTFTAHGVYGVSVVTSVTAQNSVRINQSFDLSPSIIEAQLEALFADFKIDAIKTGMLSNAKIIKTVCHFLSRKKIRNLVVDPVTASKSKFPLLKKEALDVLKAELLPLTRLVTPNLIEAEILSGMKIKSAELMKVAAIKIRELGPAVLIKGGHAPFQKATDLFFNGKSFRTYNGNYIEEKDPHGTGCVYSAAIAAQLARGTSLQTAIELAKAYIEERIRHSIRLGRGHEIL